MHKQSFGVEQVKEAPYILCVGAQWLGERDVMLFSKWEHGTVPMLKAIHKLLTEADMVVGKNSEKFDLAWIRTELAKYKIGPFPMVTHVDLEQVVRGKFRFHSNKLEYIVQYLDIGRKVEHEGFGLWRKVMEGDTNAEKRMGKYCIGDVRVTGKLYLRLRPFIENHPAFRAIGSHSCQACGSSHTHRRGKRFTACYEIQRYECQNCGRWFQGERKKVA